MDYLIIPAVILAIWGAAAILARRSKERKALSDMTDEKLSMESHFTGRFPNIYGRELQRRHPQ